jgi:hypothetical protein
VKALAQANDRDERAERNLSLTPEFSSVVTRSDQQKPFKRLPASGCAGTWLKPGVNKK